MRTLENTTVAEAVNRNMKTGEILRKYGIDYCCNGEIPVKMAAEGALANLVSLERELKKIKPVENDGRDASKMEVDALIDLIVNEHHEYVKETIPVIIYYASRVARRNSEAHPELIQIQRLFIMAVKELEEQMRNKEIELFPCIKQLSGAKKEGQTLETSICDLEERLGSMKDEHLETIYIFKRIASLTNDYVLPPDVRNPFRILYEQLSQFEQKLYQQFHLQNNILFPRATQLGKELGLS